MNRNWPRLSTYPEYMWGRMWESAEHPQQSKVKVRQVVSSWTKNHVLRRKLSISAHTFRVFSLKSKSFAFQIAEANHNRPREYENVYLQKYFYFRRFIVIQKHLLLRIVKFYKIGNIVDKVLLPKKKNKIFVMSWSWVDWTFKQHRVVHFSWVQIHFIHFS